MTPVDATFTQQLLKVMESNQPDNVRKYSQDEINALDKGLNSVILGILSEQHKTNKPQLTEAEVKWLKELLGAIEVRCEEIARLDSEHSLDSARALPKRVLAQLESGEIKVKPPVAIWG